MAIEPPVSPSMPMGITRHSLPRKLALEIKNMSSRGWGSPTQIDSVSISLATQGEEHLKPIPHDLARGLMNPNVPSTVTYSEPEPPHGSDSASAC